MDEIKKNEEIDFNNLTFYFKSPNLYWLWSPLNIYKEIKNGNILKKAEEDQ